MQEVYLRGNGRLADGVGRGLPVRGEFRHAEIQNLGWAPINQKDVRGLDVSMKDTLGVRRF